MFWAVAVIVFQDWLHSGGLLNWALYSPRKVRVTIKAVKQAGNFIASSSERQVCAVLVESCCVGIYILQQHVYVETLANVYQTSRRHIPDDSDLHENREL